jgi:cholesterol transport system auxiliary component
MKTHLAILLCLVLATGCASVITGKPYELYTLSPKSTFPADLPQVTSQLVINEPNVARTLDTDRIALRPEPLQIKYFANARWVSRVPELIQTLLIESFDNSGRITAVGSQAISLLPDYVLATDLREFQVDYFKGDKPVACVHLGAKLIHSPTARIISSRTFSGEQHVEEDSMGQLVQSLDAALGVVLKDCVSWTLRELEQAEAKVAG